MQIFDDENGKIFQKSMHLFAYIKKKLYLCTRKG